MTVMGEEVSCNVEICFCVACWTQISMGCMGSSALFQKVHHPWPTSKSETISHDKASLGQGEISFPNWAGRFCLSDCWAGQNLSRLHGQPWNQWALWLLTYQGVIQPCKVPFSTDLSGAATLTAALWKQALAARNEQGPEKLPEGLCSGTLFTHLARWWQSDSVTAQAATSCCFWGTCGVCTDFQCTNVSPESRARS